MKLHKCLAGILAAGLLGGALAGCGKANEPKEEGSTAIEDDGGKLKIGISFYALSGEFNAALNQGIEKYVEENQLEDTVEINILDAQSDANKQNSQVETLIADKVDTIIMVPGDADAQATVVREAKEAEVPLIELCTSTVAVEERTSYVGSDDVVSGRLLMEALGEASGGSGKMVILHGPTGVSAEVKRHEGAEAVIKEKGWDYEIVAEKVCDWSREEAMSAVENIIQSGLEFDVIFAENDEMAVGALSAMEGSGLEGEVFIGGIDAIPDALKAVKEGKMNCTIFQDAAGQAEKVMEVAIQCAKGEEIEKAYDVPFQTVTKENVDQFLN